MPALQMLRNEYCNSVERPNYAYQENKMNTITVIIFHLPVKERDPNSVK